MPIHDWTRVSAGTFHDFHNAWNVEVRNALNGGLLPPRFYAQTEQTAGDVVPDVLTPRTEPNIDTMDEDIPGGATAVAAAPPKVRFVAEAEMEIYTSMRRTLVIHHASDDRIVALLEILSFGNKAGKRAFRQFLDKAVAALDQGINLLLVDLYPPTTRDSQGIHGAIWSEICDESYTRPADKPLTLVAYSAGLLKKAYIEPIAVGDPLPDMPLFLDPDAYINVPLEQTYQAAYRGVPEKWRRVLEA